MTRRRELEDQRQEALERAFTAELALERAGGRVEAAEERARALALEVAEVRSQNIKLEAERDQGWAAFARRRVIVNTNNGEGFAGILWETGDPLVLRDAELLGADGKPLPSPQRLDGEVIIDFARVAWVQVPTAATEV